MDFFGINYSNLSNEANSIIRDLEEFEDKSLDQIVQDIFLRDTLDNIKHQLRWIATYVKEHTYED